jgi:isopentenyl diphosphate isomerase/L-lactate dehydrogenase-like FMN-dependent dehydrogenase
MSQDQNVQFLTLHEFIKAAKMRLNPMIWDYLVGASETETTMRRNRYALDSIALRPRILRDVSHIECTSTLFGKPMRLPVVLAPVGSLQSFEPGGGTTAAKAVERFGAGMMLSSVSEPGLEAARAAAPTACMIFQLYVRGDDAHVDAHARRAIEAGYDAFAITVDTAVYSRRERDIAKRFVKYWRSDAAGMEYQAALSWKDIARFKKMHKIPLILKGIGTAEDAIMAVEHGVDAVYVSNHGGRQLDHGLGSIDVLGEVVAAVRGKTRIIVDGGFSRGTDVLKAIAMGADAVGIGRLYCYALAAGGEAAVVRMLEILEVELESAMGLVGVTTCGELDPNYLRFGAPVVAPPHVHGAFPLLSLDDPGYGGR